MDVVNLVALPLEWRARGSCGGIVFHSCSLLQLVSTSHSLSFVAPLSALPCLWGTIHLVSSCFILSYFLSIFLCNYKFHLSGGLSVYDLFLFLPFLSYSILIHLKVDFGFPGATSSWYIIFVFVLYFLVTVPFKFLLSFCRGSSSRFRYPQITVFWK